MIETTAAQLDHQRSKRRDNPQKLPYYLKELLYDVTAREGIKWPKPLSIQFRQEKRGFNGASGRAGPGGLHISLYGPDTEFQRQDARLVLLHELAHWHIQRPTGQDWHSLAFWICAWKLFARYGIPRDYAIEREGRYKALAVPTMEALESNGMLNWRYE